MTARFLPVLSLFLTLLCPIESTDSLSLISCVSPNSPGPQLTCPQTYEFIWVSTAYLARTLNASPPSFCDQPTSDPSRGDCISSVDDVTNDVNTKCALYQTCRISVDFTLINCSAIYSGNFYLYVEYECLPSQINGLSLLKAIVSESMSVANQPGLIYFQSVYYPTYWSSLQGACRLQVPPNTYASWQIYDLRGRLINLPSGCAYLLQIYTKNVYAQWCGELTWKPAQFELVTSNDGEALNFLFAPQYSSSSQGMLWMSVNLTDVNGNLLQNRVNITCGRNIALDIPPWTTSVSSSSSTTSPTTTATSTTVTTTPSTSTITTTTTLTTPTTTSTTTTASTTSTATTTSSTTVASSMSSQNLATAYSPLSGGNSISSISTLAGASVSSMGLSMEAGKASTSDYSSFQDNGTELMTTQGSALKSENNKKDPTVWIIIGLTVGGGLLIIIVIIIIISVIGYRKRRRNAQKQNDMIFAWERNAATATSAPSSGTGNKKESASAAKIKSNTYCKEPSFDPYIEAYPVNTNYNASGGGDNFERSNTSKAPPSRNIPLVTVRNNEKHLNQQQVKTDQSKMPPTSPDVQVNPVYGQLPLTKYIVPLDRDEVTAAI